MIDWDCTSHTTLKYCEFCPGFVTSTTDRCLENDLVVGTTYRNMLASYEFKPTTTGGSRIYYPNTQIGGADYRFYLGNAFPDARKENIEAHMTQSNGIYFDGNDYIT